jgi:hypothetical protein
MEGLGDLVCGGFNIEGRHHEEGQLGLRKRLCEGLEDVPVLTPL